MTALAGPAAKTRLDDESVPDKLNYTIRANTFCHQGGMISLDSAGNAVPAGSGSAATTPVGVALDEVDNLSADTSISGNNGLQGAVGVDVLRGAFPMFSATGNDGAGFAQSIAQANATLPCYVVDDQTVALTDNNGARKFAGWILCVNTAGVNGGPNIGDGSNDGRVYVQVGSDFVHPGVNPAFTVGAISIAIPLAGFVVGGGTAAAITPGFAGRILRVSYSTTLVGAGAGATFAITLKIAGTLVTGGGATLTLANQTQGAELAGAAVTAANQFTAAQQITVVNAAGTVFTSGQVSVNLFLG